MTLLGASRWVGRVVLVALLLGGAGGCFTEKSFPMRQRELKQLTPAQTRQNGLPTMTRQWVEAVHPKLEPELPSGARQALTTVELVDDRTGGAKDVYRTFGLNRSSLDSIIGNYFGLLRSAQVSPGGSSYNKTDWPGYAPVEIPMPDGVKLCGRIGAPTANDLGDSYVVIAHGLFGRQAGDAMHNLAEAMRAFGHHVVAIEMRGHGETARRYPQYPFTFGLEEPRDLLLVSRWIRANRPVSRVGLIGYSVGAHHALMAGWMDANPALAGNPTSPLVRTLVRPEQRPQFDGGIFVISPVLNMIDYANSLNSRRTILDSPVRSIFQGKCAERTKEVSGKGSHKMWDLMEIELRRSRWMKLYPDYPTLMNEHLRVIDFCQLQGPAVGARRMESVRVPMLVLQAGDDPLSGSAQAVADVFAGVQNPNCGVILLREGGHGGFPSLSSSYFYSLMRAFFDPKAGPKSVENYPDLVRRDGPTRQPIPPRGEPLRMGQ